MNKYLKAVAWAVWIFLSFALSQMIGGGIVSILKTFGVDFSQMDPTILNTVAGAVIYLIMLGVSIGGSILAKKAWQKIQSAKKTSSKNVSSKNISWQSIKETIALTRKPKWSDLLKAFGFIFVYYGILFAVMIALRLALVALHVPTDFLDQKQEVGFPTFGNSPFTLILIFISLVIIPPVCEEIVCRGWLFGKISALFPGKISYNSVKFLVPTILTGLVFAISHGQINVAIDTFILSSIMCYLRVNTGSIWSGIFVHMLKNGIAFYLLFLAPMWYLLTL
jgi:membrane protease YdiL (CAAX protease family)